MSTVEKWDRATAKVAAKARRARRLSPVHEAAVWFDRWRYLISMLPPDMKARLADRLIDLIKAEINDFEPTRGGDSS